MKGNGGGERRRRRREGSGVLYFKYLPLKYMVTIGTVSLLVANAVPIGVITVM